MNDPNIELVPVIIESPFKGDVERNVRYLIACMRDAFERNEAPFASHRLYPGILNDDDPVERALGMRAGFAWRAGARRTVVYTDYGISDGMQRGIEHASTIGHLVQFRSIGEIE